MAAPILQNQNPAPEDSNVARSGPLYLELVDAVLGVDAASVIIWVDGERAWESDAPTTHWSGTKTAITDGFSYTLTPNHVWPARTGLTVQVYAEDTAAAFTDETYRFRTGTDYARIRDEFDDGVILPTLAGNGVVTETGGELIYTVNSGIDTYWYTSGRNGVLPYLKFEARDSPRIVIETEMTFWDGADGENNHALWGFYQNDTNFLWLYTDDPATASPNFRAYETINNVWTYLGQYPGGPVALPAKLRMVWTPDNNLFTFEIFDSGIWNVFASRTLSTFKPDRMYWYNRSWLGRQVIANYSYGYVDIEGRERLEQLHEQTVFGDAYALPTVSGKESHTFPEKGRGVVLPGSTGQPPSESSGLVPQGAFEDGPLTFPQLTGPQSHSFPQRNTVIVPQGPVYLEPPDKPLGPRDIAPFEDVLTYFFGFAPEFNPTTFDVEGRPHFTNTEVYHAFYYTVAGEAWNNPTADNFTGYARNGKRYTNGVEDVGPVWAPWALEAASDHRGNRNDFPLASLIVLGRYELVIFDLDTYAGTVDSLKVWMRFYWDDSNYMSLGRGVRNLQDAKMANGTLVACSQYDSSPANNGGVFCIDFKSDSQDVFKLFRADGTWNALAGRDITDRNTANPWNSLGVTTVNSESFYRISLRAEGTNGLYVVLTGEDYDPEILYLEDNALVSHHPISGNDRGEVNLNDQWYRQVLFDEQGWLWTSVGNRLHRHAWHYGGSRKEPLFQNTRDPLRRSITLPHTVRSMASARDRLYIGTSGGVYIVNRNTMEYWLGYTAVGGQGRGRLNAYKAGEILLADHSESERIYTISMTTSSYLAVPQTLEKGGAVTVIRLYDDFVLGGYTYPDLVEPGAWFSVLTPA